MSSKELRSAFLAFFEEKGHVVVPSSSLLSDDPSVLLTTAGMQQFKPYYSGEKDSVVDFGSKNTASVQKSFRTSDIDEVGDESHLTFFEMLGNFSFGGYFKEEAIRYAHEFITQKIRLSISYVSVFEGDRNVPKDTESEEIWKKVDPSLPIKYFGRQDNFWGPTGTEGPCGPTTEIYVKNADGQDIEVWNLVFNQFHCAPSGTLTPLKTPGVDTGMGLERLAMVVQETKTLFETDLFRKIIDTVVFPAQKDDTEENRRIVADHVRAVTFLVSDGIRPSNKEEGYVLRRLLRRLINFSMNFEELLQIVIDTYHPTYPELDQGTALSVYFDEHTRYYEALKKGKEVLDGLKEIDVKTAFDLYQTYGLPYEVIVYEAGSRAKFTRGDFDKLFKEHQEISRAGAEKKFKGGLADTSDEVVRLHTATHLLNAALRKVLGEHVWQKGSNITPERTRFDFTHTEKMTAEQLAEVEGLVNEWIAANLEVVREEMPREKAEELGAIGVFGEKYPDTVSIYTVKNPETEEVVSREFCGGPHVERIGELGTFKIQKEESSSAGIRRIKAVLE